MPQVRPLFPEGAVEVRALYLDLLTAAPPEDRPHVVVNMVVSADGRATLRGSADIGTRTDRVLLRHLRALSDAVMVGARTFAAHDLVVTVRDEDLVERRAHLGRPALPIPVVLSRRGDVPLDKKFFAQPQEKIVAVSLDAPDAAREALRAAGATIVAFGHDDVDLAALTRWLRAERDVRVLLSEGGPHVVARLFAARLVDEVFLTQAWRVTGEPGALSWVESPTLFEDVRLEPTETFEGDGERFGRFTVRYG